MIIQGWKVQKQIFIKHKAKLYTTVCYFVMKIGRNKNENCHGTNKERKRNEGL